MASERTEVLAGQGHEHRGGGAGFGGVGQCGVPQLVEGEWSAGYAGGVGFANSSSARR